MEQLTLKQIRRVRNLSQQEMADRIISKDGKSIHVNTYARWEEMPSQIAIEMCYKICEILEVEYDPHIFLP